MVARAASFSFQRDGAHRHLHSFPTRRSSDLQHCPAGGAMDALRVGHAGATKFLDDQTHMSSLRIACARLNAIRHTPPVGKGIDRKSTRLNSSHQIISYAVFCLKKKTEGKNAT